MKTGAFERLRAAVRRCWLRSDFFRTRWRDHGLPHGWLPDNPADVARFPLIDKPAILEAQQSDPPWGGNLCVESQDVVQIHLTSGTSGIGQERYACTAADVEVMGRSWGPQFEAIGLRRGDVALYTIPVSFLCAGHSALEGARLHRLIPIATGVAPRPTILAFLADYRAAYLYGTESFLLQLAADAERAGLAGSWSSHLKGIQSVGTSPHLLKAARQTFGAPLFEVYGCTQAAAKIATTCQLGTATGSVHFHDEHMYIETLDPETDDPVTEGRARIVISTTYRQATPVFRYDTGDVVELVPAGCCPCGDPRPGYRPGSVARTDSMMKIRGMNVWPQSVEQLLLAQSDVSEFRGAAQRRQDGSDELLIRIRPAPGVTATDSLIARLERSIREATLVRPHIVLDPDIPDADGDYKVRRWTDVRKSAVN